MHLFGMAEDTIQFSDGAAYERYMGVWSQRAGEGFLEWLAPEPGLRWLDVGCGNGAFTELLATRAAPASLHGIDPSEAQLAFARARPALRGTEFKPGDAMALPYPVDVFDAAVMPLVIFFLPDPAKGVAEMARVTAPGGMVTAYSWDMPGQGFPYAALQAEMRAQGMQVPMPPNPDAARLDVLRDLWARAGLVAIAIKALTVKRFFSGFDEYWSVIHGAPSVGPTLRGLGPADSSRLRERMRAVLPSATDGRLELSARAHAIAGRVPA
jgi:SAM-dependent methyltransferase